MEKQVAPKNDIRLNLNYATECSALAFHKALIGVSELKAIEAVRDNEEAGGLRICKAIVSYYIAYHFMISVMLLDENLWESTIKDEVSNLRSLKYMDKEIEDICHPNKSGVMSSYCAHLIELADKVRLKKDIKEIWEPLKCK